jgi:hypothetical protein
MMSIEQQIKFVMNRISRIFFNNKHKKIKENLFFENELWIQIEFQLQYFLSKGNDIIETFLHSFYVSCSDLFKFVWVLIWGLDNSEKYRETANEEKFEWQIFAFIYFWAKDKLIG